MRALRRRYGSAQRRRVASLTANLPPGVLPEPTHFSDLSEHDWNVLRSRAMRGAEWTTEKLGNHWTVQESFGKKWPLYSTRGEASDAIDNLIAAEALRRALLRRGIAE